EARLDEGPGEVEGQDDPDAVEECLESEGQGDGRGGRRDAGRAEGPRGRQVGRKRAMSGGGGDWLLLQGLLDRGEPEFVDRLRAVTDADALGQFAERWYAHPSPGARRLLLEYLERPLNAYRHEALVKRLFKQAEAAGDDAVMARFLVAFDRSVRRVTQRTNHYEQVRPETRAEAQQIVSLWNARGYESVDLWENPVSRAPR